MLTDLFFTANPWLLPLVMALVLALAIELPFRYLDPKLGGGAVNDGVLAGAQAGLLTLSAFVLGLSFAQASARFDARRSLVVQEANAIGTTWLRAGQLSSVETQRFRDILTRYTAERIDAYRHANDSESISSALRESFAEQDALWEMSSSAMRARPHDLGVSLLMQTLNDTIDVSAAQLQALRGHVPSAMVTLMLGLVTLSAFATGVRFAYNGSRPLVITATVVTAYVVVICMSIDYDRPQSGLVTVDLSPLQRQLQTMQSATGRS